MADQHAQTDVVSHHVVNAALNPHPPRKSSASGAKSRKVVKIARDQLHLVGHSLSKASVGGNPPSNLKDSSTSNTKNNNNNNDLRPTLPTELQKVSSTIKNSNV